MMIPLVIVVVVIFVRRLAPRDRATLLIHGKRSGGWGRQEWWRR
jgi:hypothetical protein